jgi:hypothetical protein
MTVALSAFLLGAAGQQVPSRQVRLSLGATWRPDSAAMSVVSGVVYGPAGSMGELTLVNPTTLGVNPFVAVIQGTHSAVQGQYLVLNDTYRTLAITAQHASQWRRALICVTVDDSEAAGVASSPTTDRGRLHLLDGALSATDPAALPAAPHNTLALGYVNIPPTGQAVTVTSYSHRTAARGGVLPVQSTGWDRPGHSGFAPRHDGEYRHHPLRDLEFGLGGLWVPPPPGPVAVIGPHTPGSIQTLSHNTWTKVLVLLPSEDPYGGYSGASAYRWVCPAGMGGVYEAVANGRWTGLAAGRRFIGIRKNEVQLQYGEGAVFNGGSSAAYNTPSIVATYRLAPGDHLTMWAFQDSGSSLALQLEGCYWTVKRIAL